MDWTSLLRFANLSDAKQALQNPSKAIRVIQGAIVGGESTSVDDPIKHEKARSVAIEQLFDVDQEKILSLVDECHSAPLYDRLKDCEVRMESEALSLGGMKLGGETAYLITRILEPKTVLEVGVANGVSTLYVLGGLEKSGINADARAIDKPLFESDILEKRALFEGSISGNRSSLLN